VPNYALVIGNTRKLYVLYNFIDFDIIQELALLMRTKITGKKHLHSAHWGTVFLNFKKIYMRHKVLDQKKNSKNILRKGIFLYCDPFLLNWGFVSKNLKNSPSEVKFFFLEISHIGFFKNPEFYADFENPNLLQ
jgi:hypothetical protein